MASTMVKLQSKTGEEFSVPRNIACMSVTIASMLEDFEEDEECPPLPLDNVDSDTLRKVIEYCTYHEENKERPQEEKSKWDKQFVELEDEPLFQLILAANYLDIKSLLDLTCRTVAEIIKTCKSPQEIRTRFNIKNDFTKEEEEEVRRENAWALE
eukprot:CAMPEP_0113908230 /NCGR_PEP_ID=MMETSP0780_2-20120614/26023_1 /TAXON_ID=652834 /ORGANISM="Palpitomonas bilix" /LENGTH=154 /DNA_ID=CAMNT_0000903589 /DNA_START=1 /DNA_END=465 /DNA_ORIENTATION=+ /assembly_acc=CAM_ASM_000599